MKTGFIYSRILSEGQRDGTGLTRQTGAELVNYILSLGHVVGGTPKLQDVASGYHGDNLVGDLGIFLDAVESGLVKSGESFLAIEDWDRLTRLTPWDAIPTFQSIINHNVDLLTYMDGEARWYTLASLKGNPNLLDEVLDGMKSAHYFSKKLAARIKGMYKRKIAENAIYSGSVPSWIVKKYGAINPRSGRSSIIGFELGIGGDAWWGDGGLGCGVSSGNG